MIRLRDEAGAQRALGGGGDEVARDLADALLHLGLAPLPRLAAELVERDVLALGPVARQHLEILDGHVQLVAARIVKRDAVVRRLADGDLRQPLEPADAVIGMDDEVAGRQRRELRQERVRGLLALGAADEPVAEHVLLGDHRHVGGGEPVIEREDGERGLRPQRLLPRVRVGEPAQAMVGEQPAHPLPAARGVARDDD